MKLNEKYQKIADGIEKIIEANHESLASPIMQGLIFRQILELHQKIDEIKEVTADKERPSCPSLAALERRDRMQRRNWRN